MSIVILKEQVLDALHAVNVPEDLARAAAISMTAHEPKNAELRLEIAPIKGMLNTVQWMLGAVIALVVGVLLKLFQIH